MTAHVGGLPLKELAPSRTGAAAAVSDRDGLPAIGSANLARAAALGMIRGDAMLRAELTLEPATGRRTR